MNPCATSLEPPPTVPYIINNVNTFSTLDTYIIPNIPVQRERDSTDDKDCQERPCKRKRV